MDADKKSLTSLKDIIGDLFKAGGLSFNPDDARIWHLWDEVVGPAIAGNARPAWIQKGQLRVRVSDPIWLQELSFAENSIRERLNLRLGREAVKKIEFRLGRQ